MELELRGFRSDKRVQAKVTWVAEDNYLEHQLNVQVRDVRLIAMNHYITPSTMTVSRLRLGCCSGLFSITSATDP